MDVSPFSPDALAANRGGQPSDDQLRVGQLMARSQRQRVRGVALPFGAIGLVLFFFANGPASNAGSRQDAGVVFLLIAAGFVVASSRLPLSADVSEGRLETVEGAVGKRIFHGAGRSPRARYYVSIGDTRLRTNCDRYEATPDAGLVRAFYWPRSRRLVNLEQLPDRPVAPGPHGAQEIVSAIAHAALGGHGTAGAEARADAIGLVNAVTGSSPIDHTASARGTSPAARLRAEDLYGEWTNPLVTVRFEHNGTATLTMFGAARSGHWSIDEAGRLVTDATGAMQPIDARRSGDSLQIQMDGRTVSLTRKS